MTPHSADALLKRAQQYLREGNPLKAEAAFNEARGEAGAMTSEIASGLGMALLLQHRAEEAHPLLKRAAASKGAGPEVTIALLRTLNRLGRYKDGLALTKEFASRMQNNPGALFLHGEQLLRCGRTAEGDAALRDALQRDQGLRNQKIDMIPALLTAQGDFDGAASLLRKVLAANPDHDSRQNLLTACLEKTDFAATAEDIAHGGRSGLEPTDYYQAAVFLERRSLYAAAIAAVDRALSARTEFLLARSLKARLLVCVEDFAAASAAQKDLWNTASERLSTAETTSATRRTPRWALDVQRTPAPILYLPVEIAGREMDTRLLLARAAASRGFTSVVLGYGIFRADPSLLPPGVVLYKSYNALDAKLIERCREGGHLFTAIDEEAFGWTGGAFSMARAAGLENLDLCAAVFAPGEAYVSDLRSLAPHFAEKFIASGSPRTDFYGTSLRHLAVKDAEALRHAESSHILVCTNFGGWNSAANAYSTVCRTALALPGCQQNSEQGRWLLDAYRDAAEAECRNTAAVLDAIPALRRAFPEHKIIVRPHPAENGETWRHLLRECEGVSVSSDGSLAARIIAADALVHLPGCGTGLEAWLLGRPSISLDMVADLHYPRLGLSAQTSEIATSMESLVALVRNACEAPETLASRAQDKTELVQAHLSLQEGTVSKTIAAHLVQLFTERTGHGPETAPVPHSTKKAIAAALKMAADLMHLNAKADVRRDTAKRLTATSADVLDFLSRTNAAGSENERFSVEAPVDGAFILGYEA